MSTLPMFHYIVLHHSVKNHPGVCAVQSAHAAAESISGPIPQTTRVVALVAEDATDLYDLANRLKEAGVHHALIEEPDAPYNGSATAVGIEPCDEAARPFIKSFVETFKVLR